MSKNEFTDISRVIFDPIFECYVLVTATWFKYHKGAVGKNQGQCVFRKTPVRCHLWMWVQENWPARVRTCKSEERQAES